MRGHAQTVFDDDNDDDNELYDVGGTFCGARARFALIHILRLRC